MCTMGVLESTKRGSLDGVPGARLSAFVQGILPTSHVGQLFGFPLSNHANPPDFMALVSPEIRFFIASEGGRPGLTKEFEIVDWFTRRKFLIIRSIEYGDDIEFTSEDAIKELLAYVDSMEHFNTLTIHGRTCTRTLQNTVLRQPLQDICYETVDKFPADAQRLRIDTLSITGAWSHRHYIVGHYAQIFRTVAFEARVTLVGNEIRALLQIGHHPYIAPCRHIVTDSEANCVLGYLSDLYPGGTLQENAGFKWHYIVQLMRTVDDLNFKHNVSHGDLHPANVVLDAQDDIKLIDFELASCDAFLPCIAVEADAASVVAIAYHLCTGRSTSEADDPALLAMGGGARHHIQCARGDRAMAEEWPTKGDIDVTSLKTVLRFWQQVRTQPDYSWMKICDEFSGANWLKAVSNDRGALHSN